MKEVITGERYIRYFEIMLAYEASELSVQDYQRALGRLKLSNTETTEYRLRYGRDTGNPPEHTTTRSEHLCDFPRPIKCTSISKV